MIGLAQSLPGAVDGFFVRTYRAAKDCFADRGGNSAHGDGCRLAFVNVTSLDNIYAKTFQQFGQLQFFPETQVGSAGQLAFAQRQIRYS